VVQSERGEGGGVEGGDGEGEVRSMTSLGFIHSSFGMADTPAHIFMASLHLSLCVFLLGLALQFSAAFAYSLLLSHVSWASLV